MRYYMPGPHRRFLEYVAQIANIRSYAMSLPAVSGVRQAYNAAVMTLASFRDKHIQIVARYVIAPARQRQHHQDHYQVNPNEEEEEAESPSNPPSLSPPGLKNGNRINLATATLQSLSSSASPAVSPISSGSEIMTKDADAASPQNQENTKTLFYGTGGTALIPFLKQTRDETKAAAQYAD
jgi:indoleamine 2,3-dioxygenase